MQTASDTTRDSEIPADNSLKTLQQMTYQDEINIKKEVTNVNPIPTHSPNVTTPQKNEKLTPNSNLEIDVDNSLKKNKLLRTKKRKLSNLTSLTLTSLLPLPVLYLPPKIIKK